MTEAEEWRAIPDVAGYEVSNLGHVRSVDRVVDRRRYGRIVKVRRRGVVLRTKIHTKTGYVGVELAGVDHNVHRLVLSAFIGPCPLGMEGAHWDGVRVNNRLENLRYATPAENADDRRRHGTHVHGERVGNSKLTLSQVEEIRSAKGLESQYALAARFGVTRQQIGHIHHGRVWVTEPALGGAAR